MSFLTRGKQTALILDASFCAAPVMAQDFPTKPIKMVVVYAAGGPTDVIARLVAEDAQKALGQTVVIENKSGANGNIATEDVPRAPADGYALIVNTLPN